MSILARSNLLVVFLLFVCTSLGCHQANREAMQPQEEPQAAPLAASPYVRAELSSAETQVGIPIFFTITVKEMKVRQSPPLPSIPDMEVVDAGSKSSSFNGRLTSTYRFALTPQKTGSFTIPAVTVQAGDRYYQTEEFTVSVSEPKPQIVPLEVKGK